MSEKRMIGGSGYSVIQSQWAGGKEYILAENLKISADQRYLVCNYTTNGILGQYADAVADDDRSEAVQEFDKRVSAALEEVKNELDQRGLPVELFTAEHCIPYDYGQDIRGYVVAIKEEALAPEYRRGSEQLVYVTGGFGATANARGNAVYCWQLSDEKQVGFERYQVLGIVKELPDWAQECLASVKTRITTEYTKSTKDRSDAR